MTRNASLAIYVAAMIVLIVGVDIFFLQGRFWVRLIANVGIVLIFGALYLAFLRKS